MPYERGCYTDVAPFWGDRLWAFLGETQVLIVMLAAIKAGKSPAEAINCELTRRFGKAVRQKRVQEFTGYLVSQAMASYFVKNGELGSRGPQFTGPEAQALQGDRNA
jgi:hypothetical protein